MRMSAQQKRRAAVERLEEAVVDLLNAAEHFSLTGLTLWDLRNKRRDLLAKAYRYGRAVARVNK